MTEIQMLGSINQNQFEVLKVGLSNFPIITVSNPGAGNYNSGEAITTIAHNLGFVPSFLIFLQFNSQTYMIPAQFTSGSGATAEFDNFQVSADATNIYLLSDLLVYAKAQTIGGSAYACKYYLLRERTRS